MLICKHGLGEKHPSFQQHKALTTFALFLTSNCDDQKFMTVYNPAGCLKQGNLEKDKWKKLRIYISTKHCLLLTTDTNAKNFTAQSRKKAMKGI